MEIKRDEFLKKIIDRKDNNSIKVITGIRRCGKSYLLFNLYYKYLLSTGINPDHIITIALDDEENENLLDRKKLGEYIRSQIKDSNPYYLLLDEIQYVENFEKLLNGLNRYSNLDIYVTGSNSKFLSTDILSQFRGRGDEVRIYPLTFAEYSSAYEGTIDEAWQDYFTYGGMPLILSRKTPELKSKYLLDLLKKVYLSDIVDHNGIRNNEVLETLLNILASAVGSLTNPLNLANTFKSVAKINVSDKTLSTYINYLVESFLLEKATRYDVKGKKYIASPYKYYFADVGLRNARLNFRQQEENHIMENIIYSELLARDFTVDIGIVNTAEKNTKGTLTRKQLEIDFVCNKGSQRYYIQSAFTMPTEEKKKQELQSLLKTDDAFKKIIVVKDKINPWNNEQGVSIIGIQDFLLDKNSLEI